MHSIGNHRDAQTILDWVRSHPEQYGKPTCVDEEYAPDGWEFVGSGSFRSVWLSPEGVAYKVEHSRTYQRQSEAEIESLQRAWGGGEPPRGCRLPKFQSYSIAGEFIVAVELIRGSTLYRYKGPMDRVGLYDAMQLCETRYHLRDLHDENVVVDENGILVPVDWGC